MFGACTDDGGSEGDGGRAHFCCGVVDGGVRVRVTVRVRV